MTSVASEEEVYEVEDILEHIQYTEAFRRWHDLEKFNPSDTEERIHSKWVYKIKWKDWPIEEHTWEPESNLQDNEVLIAYKEKMGMPVDHEKIKKYFDWEGMKASGPKASASQFMISPALLPTSRCPSRNDVAESVKEEEPMDAEAFGDISLKTEKKKKKYREPSPIPTAGSSKKHKKRAEADLSQPKKVQDHKQLKKTGSRDLTPKPRKDVDEFMKVAKSINREINREESVPPPSKPSDSDGNRRQIAVIRYAVENFGDGGRDIARELHRKRRCISLERLNDRWQPAIEWEKKKREGEKWAEVMTRIVSHAMQSAPSLHLPASVPVFMHEVEYADGVATWRVKGNKSWKKFLKKNNIPIKLKVKQAESSLSQDSHPSATSSSDDVTSGVDTPSQDLELRAEPVSEDVSVSSFHLSPDALRVAEEDCQLLVGRLRTEGAGLTLNEESVVKKLGMAYAEANSFTVFNHAMQFGESKTRFRVIQELVKTVRLSHHSPNCVQPQERDSHRLAKLMVTSDESSANSSQSGKGVLPAYNQCSSEGSHWKCSLLYRLICAMPPEWRFVVDSSPFSVDVFAYCMRHGAHCQKMVFLLTGMPLGLTSVKLNDFQVDPMMFAMHQDNPRYMVDFMRLGMLDVKMFGWREKEVVTTFPAVTKTSYVPVPTEEVFDIMEKQDHTCDDAKYIGWLRSFLVGFGRELGKFCHRRMISRLESLLSASVAGVLTPAHTFRSVPFNDSVCVSALSSAGNGPDSCFRVADLDHEAIKRDDFMVVLSVYAVNIIGGRIISKEGSPDIFVPFLFVRNEQPDVFIQSALLYFNDSETEIELTECYEEERKVGQWHFKVPNDKSELLEEGMMHIVLKTSGEANRAFVTQLQVIATPLY